MKKKIIHLIVSLGSGGAEKTLYNLVTNDNENYHKIITLKKDNFYKSKFIEKNITINELDFINKSKIFEFFKLVKLLKKDKPDILQTWLYHSDFIGSIAGKISGIKKIIWNIRGTLKPKMNFKRLIYYKSISILSYFIPNKIISCSLEGIQQHINFGYRENIFHYIPNGVLLGQTKNSKKFQKSFINKYNINNKIVISMIARYHEQKNHNFLLDCFYELEKIFKDEIALLLIGRNIKNEFFKKKKIKHDFKNIIFLDEVENINSFYNVIHLHVLTSSYGEGFPNVILETLANGIPNISSDIGDAKIIIKNDKLIYKNSNKSDFIKIIKNVLLKIKNRERVFYKYINERSVELKREYSIEKMVLNYRKIWEL